MAFNPSQINLPVVSVLSDISRELSAGNTLLVSAPPGAGKSTLVPLALLGEPWMAGQKMIVLEPRRLAAKAIAERMADLLGELVGETVGYRIRFDHCIGDKTRIEVVTEGILTRMLQNDNSLEGVGLVLFDEFHERSLFADVAMALCRDAQQVLRPDLRMVLMSATLDLPGLSDLLNAPVVSCNGRQFPVQMNYTGNNDPRQLPVLTAQTILKALHETRGDILAFLPGKGEIKRCEELLTGQVDGCLVYSLYGMLEHEQQQAAILPDRQGRRKIILATSIAETSLTIEGVSVVVDCGYGRYSRFNPRTGLSGLETLPVSLDVADQRAGRAGRLGPGVCYRMWTTATHHHLAGHRQPEIVEADLAGLMLDLARWGVADPSQLAWLTPPPAGAVQQASDLLHQLGALGKGRITGHGREMHRLPCHPRIAHMLILAARKHLLPLATDLAALLEERDPLPPETGIDINLRIEALRLQRRQKGLSNAMKKIEKAAASYRQLMNNPVENDLFDRYITGLLLMFAYPERIACVRPGQGSLFQLANGSLARTGQDDDLAHEPWLAVAHVGAREGGGTIFLASPLNSDDLDPLITTRDLLTWETRKGGVIAVQEQRIGSLVVRTKPLPTPDSDQLKQVISEAIKKEGERLLNFSESVERWQNRVLSLRCWNPDQGWPDVSTSELLQTNSEWLSPYLNGVRKPEDLKKIDLADVLQYWLNTDLRRLLDELAPARITVPSGSSVTINYQAHGEPPVLAVRLQEVFGLADTPCINNGKIPVVVHLLSPGYKPVQITSDLRSFWNTTYFEVKKELKRRYPKHAWPDDPWTEKAIRGVKRKT